MRAYTNSFYTQADMHATALKMGVWEQTCALQVPIRLQGDTAHFGPGSHESSASVLTECALEHLPTTWCWCLTRALVDPYVNYRYENYRQPALPTIQLVALEYYLQLLCTQYEKKSTRTVRQRIDALTREVDQAWYRHAETDAQLSKSLHQALEYFTNHALQRARDLLADRERNQQARNRALQALAGGTYLAALPRNETELLVGCAGRSTLSSGAFQALLNNVLSTSIVHRQDGREFYQIPVFAYQYLERAIPEPGLALQAIPWDDALDLTELATLWNPDNRSALCALEHAAEALRLL